MLVWIDSAPAPTIILGLTLIFIAAFIWKSFTIRRVETGGASQKA